MACDVDREDWRTFRLDRMRSVAPTTWRFKQREHEDPAAYVQRSVSQRGVPPPGPRAACGRRCAEVAERTSVRWVILTAIDDSTTLLEAGAETLYGLAFHLSWLGLECEVQDPPELRTRRSTWPDGCGGRCPPPSSAAPGRGAPTYARSP